MSNHKIQHVGFGSHSQVRCSCKKTSPIGSTGDCEEWVFTHLTQVERVRAQLGTRNPTMRSQYAWFLDQAENEDNPAEDRALWRQLADEMYHFVAQLNAVPLQQDALF